MTIQATHRAATTFCRSLVVHMPGHELPPAGVWSLDFRAAPSSTAQLSFSSAAGSIRVDAVDTEAETVTLVLMAGPRATQRTAGVLIGNLLYRLGDEVTSAGVEIELTIIAENTRIVLPASPAFSDASAWGDPIDLAGQDELTVIELRERGLTGPRGPVPAHQWSGTALAFEQPGGGFGPAVDLRGEPGSLTPAAAEASAAAIAAAQTASGYLAEIGTTWAASARAIGLPTVAAIASAVLAAATSIVATAGFAAPGDGGGARYERVATQPARGGYRSADRYLPDGTTDAAAGGWWRIAEPAITSAMLGDAIEAAEVAYSLGRPLFLTPTEEAYITINPSAGGDMQRATKWLHGQAAGGKGEILQVAGCYMMIADGVHTVSTHLPVYGPGGLVDIRASAPTLINITSIAYALVTGTLWEATVGVAAALPDGVVVGGPIGCRYVCGDNDAGALTGGQIVHSIAGNRMSFAVRFHAPRGGLVSPTTITYGTDLWSGQQRSQVLCHKASIIAQASGWGGADREGFINLWPGGQMTIRHFGLAFSSAGGVGTAHDLAFVRGAGSSLHIYDTVTLAGAGTSGYPIRLYDRSACFANRACIGAAGTSATVINTANRASLTLSRACIGGSSSYQLVFGTGAEGQIDGSHLASGIRGIYSIGAARVSVATTRIVAAPIGAYAQDATIIYTDTYFERCTTAIDWGKNGYHIDNGITTDGFGGTAPVYAVKGTTYAGGGWMKDASRALMPEAIRVSMPNTSVYEIGLLGVGGRLEISSETDQGLYLLLSATLTTVTSATAHIAGANVAMGTGAIAIGGVAGKFVASVYSPSSGVYKLRLVNDRGGARAVNVSSQGRIGFDGFFVAAS